MAMNHGRARNRGFTLIEMMIVGAMMGFVAILLSNAWQGLGEPSIETMVRCRVGQEAQLAVMSLAADLGGHLVATGTTVFEGANEDRKLSTINGESALLLVYKDGTQIYYENGDDYSLVRSEAGGSAIVVARKAQMTLEDEDKAGVPYIKITLTFRFLFPEDAPTDASDKMYYLQPYDYVFHVRKNHE